MPGNSIDGALPRLVAAYGDLQIATRSLGIAWKIADFGGLRTQADTARILAYREEDWARFKRDNPTAALKTTIGAWRPIAPWGRSMHNYGAAFDVQIVGVPVGMSRLRALNLVHDKAEQMGLVSGRAFGDPPHLELRYEGAPPGNAAVAAAQKEWQALNPGSNFFQG